MPHESGYPALTGQRERGVNPGGRPSGPREGNRLRQTMTNLLSKNTVNYQNPGGAAALPALSPADTANYYAQLAGQAAQYQLTRTNLRAQRVGLQADFSAERAGIVLERKRGIADVESEALERGLLGSSIQATGITDVRADVRSRIAAAKTAQIQARQQNRLAQQQAGLDYYMAGTQLEAQALASKQDLLAQQLAQNLVVSGQETNMDILKAMYEAQAGMMTGGAAQAGASVRRRGRSRSAFTAAREGGGF